LLQVKEEGRDPVKVGSRRVFARIAVATVAAFGLLMATAAGTARAANPPADYVVAQVPMSNAGGSNAVENVVQILFCIDNDFQNCLTHSDSLTFPLIGIGSAGSTIEVDTSSPGFAAVVAQLTDGALDQIGYIGGTPNYVAGPGWFISPEPDFFGTQVGPSGIDLAGYAIDKIGFRVDSISLASPGSDPNGDGIWTDFSISGAFLFEGRIASKEVCMNGGWQSLHGPGGAAFHNQGECIQLVNTGK
jgi:hypothetical protein